MLNVILFWTLVVIPCVASSPDFSICVFADYCVCHISGGFLILRIWDVKIWEDDGDAYELGWWTVEWRNFHLCVRLRRSGMSGLVFDSFMTVYILMLEFSRNVWEFGLNIALADILPWRAFTFSQLRWMTGQSVAKQNTSQAIALGILPMPYW